MSFGRGSGFGTIALVIVAALLVFGQDPSGDTGSKSTKATGKAARSGSAKPKAAHRAPGSRGDESQGDRAKPAGGGGSAKPATGGGAQGHPAEVLRAVDGDTIQVNFRGRTEYVRYIGVDTPETVKPGTPVQCYGENASAFNHKLVDGRIVRLVFDHELRDYYDRLLAYVYVGPTFVNAELVRRGYARTLEIAPNTSKAAMFGRLEEKAGRVGRGLWSAC